MSNNQNRNNVEEYSKAALVNSACEIISDNLGEIVAEKYRNFYKGKDNRDVIDSVRELLTDLVGEENAKKQIKIKFNI